MAASRTRRFLVGILLIALMSLGIYIYKSWSYHRALSARPVAEATERIRFEITSGQTAKEIAQKLQDANLIVSDWAFLWYINDQKLTSALQSGTHYLYQSMTIPEGVEVLTNKRYTEIDLVIPEGYTIAQIDAKLASPKFNLIRPGEFINACQTFTKDEYPFLASTNSLEGYLFPATYQLVTEKFSTDGLIRKMLAAFDREIYTPYQTAIRTSPRSLNDLVIMASLLEREAKNKAEERAIISGILWKRLDNNWYLGVDAALRYELNNWSEEITYQELQNATPYNTRKVRGLPPTAIGNPGQSAFKAALQPQTSDYWYYLHDEEGQVHYAVDSQEHGSNKSNFLP